MSPRPPSISSPGTSLRVFICGIIDQCHRTLHGRPLLVQPTARHYQRHDLSSSKTYSIRLGPARPLFRTRLGASLATLDSPEWSGSTLRQILGLDHVHSLELNNKLIQFDAWQPASLPAVAADFKFTSAPLTVFAWLAHFLSLG